MTYGRGWGLFNCWLTWAVTKKITDKGFFLGLEFWPWKFFFYPFRDTWQKNRVFRYFPLSSRPFNYSALKIWTISNIIYPQERNMRTAGYRLSMRRGFWAPCDPSYQEDPNSRPYVALGKFCAKVITYFLFSVRKCSCRVTCGVWRRYHFIREH